MPRLVDADALEKRMSERLRTLRKQYGYHDHYTDGFDEGCVAVEDAETISPESLRPKGRLGVSYTDECYGEWADCLECGTDNLLPCNYCRNCGAKMEG